MSPINTASIRGIRLRHLRGFLEAASERNITRAAQNLGTVQPTLSRTLRELEDLLGTRLFERSREGLVLTEDGRTFCDYAHRALSQIAEGAARLRLGDKKITLSIGAQPNVTRTLLPECLVEFKRHNPGITVRVHTSSNADILNGLRAGALDVAVGVGVDTQSMSGILFERLSNEELIFAARHDHPLIGTDTPGFSAVDCYPVVIPLTPSTIRQDLDNYLVSVGADSFSDVIETASVEFACAYARECDAVIVYPASAIKLELDSGAFKPLFVADIHLISATGLAFAKERDLSAEAQQLVDIIRARAAALRTIEEAS